MNHLRLNPEVQCWAVWVRRGEVGVHENVHPDSLEVSDELASKLVEWSKEWNSTYDLVNDPGNPKFDSEAAERRFWGEGENLANLLRAELGAGWNVEYDPRTWYPDRASFMS